MGIEYTGIDLDSAAQSIHPPVLRRHVRGGTELWMIKNREAFYIVICKHRGLIKVEEGARQSQGMIRSGTSQVCHLGRVRLKVFRGVARCMISVVENLRLVGLLRLSGQNLKQTEQNESVELPIGPALRQVGCIQ